MKLEAIDMKIKKFAALIILLFVLVLEMLPYGAVLNFGNPEGTPWRETYSYFDPTPFGYANFGPLLTAVLTCVMLVMALVYLVRPVSKVLSLWKGVSVAAFVISISPLLYGTDSYSFVGGLISALLLVEYFLLKRRGKV